MCSTQMMHDDPLCLPDYGISEAQCAVDQSKGLSEQEAAPLSFHSDTFNFNILFNS